MDAFAGCWKQFGGQAGVCADVGHNVVRGGAIQLRPEDAEARDARGRDHARRRSCWLLHRIDDHFGIGIPEERSINPYGTTRGEGVGIQPDIKVPAAAALKPALRQAQSQIQKNKISLQHD